MCLLCQQRLSVRSRCQAAMWTHVAEENGVGQCPIARPRNELNRARVNESSGRHEEVEYHCLVTERCIPLVQLAAFSTCNKNACVLAATTTNFSRYALCLSAQTQNAFADNSVQHKTSRFETEQTDCQLASFTMSDSDVDVRRFANSRLEDRASKHRGDLVCSLVAICSLRPRMFAIEKKTEWVIVRSLDEAMNQFSPPPPPPPTVN